MSLRARIDMNANAPTDELVENLDAIFDVLVGGLKYERERAYRSVILQEITAGLKRFASATGTTCRSPALRLT